MSENIFNANHNVKELVKSDFDGVKYKNPGKKVGFIMFYAPWCPHCEGMLEPWSELSLGLKKYDIGVEFSAFNCENEAAGNKTLSAKIGIQGFPTIKWFDINGNLSTPLLQNNKEMGRSKQEILAFICEKMQKCYSCDKVTCNLKQTGGKRVKARKYTS